MDLDPLGEIRTERVSLRPLDPSDADEMMAVLSDAGLYEFTGGEPPDLDELRHRDLAQVAGPTDGREQWLNWIVRRLEDRSAIGYVQATVVDDTVDVAWLIGVAHQRAGFAAEAAVARCRWLERRGPGGSPPTSTLAISRRDASPPQSV